MNARNFTRGLSFKLTIILSVCKFLMNEKIVLAYSGGLDTSVILRWLVEQGHEVIALCVDVGQRLEDWPIVRQKALKSGAQDAILVDAKQTFVQQYVLPAIQMHAVYEGVYLLGTSLARPLIAKEQVLCAERLGANALSHGATGKGNDQVRFELAYACLNPDLKVIVPWRDPKFYNVFVGRQNMLEYAAKHQIPVSSSPKSPWSMDENIMHLSYEAGILEDPNVAPPADMFEWTTSPKQAPDQPYQLEILFEQGVPVALNGQNMGLLNLFKTLNDQAKKHGVGRVDVVESRFVGMKSRGVYETPAGTVLHAAHRAMESLTLTRDVIELKDSLMPRFANLVYNGFWFAPQMDLLLNLVRQSQAMVSGTVKLELYKGQITILGRDSANSLYSFSVASMDEIGAYEPLDANGFINLQALPLKIYHQHKRNAKK